MPLTADTVDLLKAAMNDTLPAASKLAKVFRSCDDYGKDSSKPLGTVKNSPFLFSKPHDASMVSGVMLNRGKVFFLKVDSFSKLEVDDDSDADGVEIKYNEKQMILRNGDENSNYLVEAHLFENFPTTSFMCLAELFDLPSTKAILSLLISGSITLLDYTPDSSVDMTDAQKKEWRNYFKRQSRDSKASPPAIPQNRIGYTVTTNGKMRWHRSGTCLFAYNGKQYLTGQDEGTYFGVELSGRPNTVNDAYIDLVPEQLRGKKWQRQGEWFVVPVKSAPRYWEKGVLAEGLYDGIVLPRDEDGNLHTVSGEDVVVTRDGIFALNGSVEHDQHEIIWFSGWVTFVKNTAVRSVSVEGVD